MASKLQATVPIVNPKDPSSVTPWIANVRDVTLNGWTLWADRHDPRVVSVREEAPVVKDKEPVPETSPKDEEPVEPKDGSAVDPSAVRKRPNK